MPLTEDIKGYLDKAAALIQAESDTEATLFEAIDYLEDEVYPPDTETTSTVERDRKHIAKIWLLVAENQPNKVINNFCEKKFREADKTESDWDNDPDVPFPRKNGEPDPEYMLVKIGSGSTLWCYYLSNGDKVCYER